MKVYFYGPPKETPLDFIIHSGDISYADDNQPLWDDYQNQLQPVTSTVPYMVTVGNHEVFANWEPFTYRFNMPAAESSGTDGNFFYSFNFGLVHFIGLNSERGDFSHTLPQYKWLEQDLANVNRQETPWVFASFHKPWYTTNLADTGSGLAMKAAYEDIFYKYKVDISFVGHIHAYERTTPMYQGAVVPDGVVTIINGNGGTKESDHHHNWVKPHPPWSVARFTHFGIGVATVYNSSTLHWQMIRASDNSVSDDWWFVRNH